MTIDDIKAYREKEKSVSHGAPCSIVQIFESY